ncbi:MAG: hypothetical protein KJO01_01610 [Gammaproteobacteria bacterium]|nr:hypothetical protein [Gammaproteobacteria bacterium]
MKNFLPATLVALVMLCFSGMTVADSIAETWSCEVKEGKKSRTPSNDSRFLISVRGDGYRSW